MDRGTKIRTALRAVVSANTAIYAVSAAVSGLHFGVLTLIWTILTIVSDFAVAFVTTYYNNDYDETAAKYTGMMRLEKEQVKGNITGENFFDSIQDGGDLEEEEEDADESDEDEFIVEVEETEGE